MTRSVFYGVSAFVGSIKSKTSCAFWPDDPNNLGFDPNKLFAVDLSKNPEAVRAGVLQAAQVEVDDFAGYHTGGLTTIGPVFPGGATVGLCYVEESRCVGLGTYDPRNGGPGQPYEWSTLVEYDGALAGRRFHGFHAQIRSKVPNTSVAIVSLWARGTSGTKPPMGTWPIDLATLAHPIAAGFTQIGVAQGNPQVGALFLELSAGTGGVIAFDDPKTPRSIGGVLAPGGHHDH
jgi:hypothetical protein